MAPIIDEKAKRLALLVDAVYVVRDAIRIAFASFVGADATCGVLAMLCELDRRARRDPMVEAELFLIRRLAVERMKAGS